MIRKKIYNEFMEEFIPESYKDRAVPIPRSGNNFYKSSDFKNESEILIFFSRASRYNPKPDAIRRCLVIDANAKRFKSGFGDRDALKVEVLEAWIVRNRELMERGIEKPHTKFFYESVKGAYRILE